MDGTDIASLLLRLIVGATMFAHGWNHAFGGGKLPGTARWFGSIGMRPPKLHAFLATATELGAGTLLVLGLATPVAAAGVIGSMLVALVANHLRNGFFIFRPGEGYEYVLMIIVVTVAIGAAGGGAISLDHVFGLPLAGWLGLVIAAGLGLLSGAATLAVGWRRPKAAE
ncbi:MAG TPA: DoxX family protein [Pseudonocardiaceae bacterium]|jgi:putative oxidoreductase